LVKLMSSLRQASFIGLVVALLVAYPVLLVPYLVHHNLPNSGMVLSSGSIEAEQLPQGIRTYLRTGSDLYYVILTQKPPVRTDQPYTEWIIAVITSSRFQTGQLVEFYDPIAALFVDWRDYPFGRSFNELVVADVIQELRGTEAYLEGIVYGPNGGILLTLSTADYYAGPLIFPLVALVFLRRLTFWSIMLAVWGYAFGQQLYNYFASIHHNIVPDELRLFGSTSFMWAAGAFLFWIYETKTARGRRVSEKVFSVRER